MIMDKKLLSSLSIASSLVALVFLILSATNMAKRTLFHTIAAFLFFASVILLNLISFQETENYKSCGCSDSAKPTEQKRPLCLTVSADSWCGYSKKMSAEKQENEKALDKAGIDYVLVSDEKDKKQFDKISKAHNVQGFPHTILIVDGKKVHDVPGYMKHQAFTSEIINKAK